MVGNAVVVVELHCLKICHHLWWIRACDVTSRGRTVTRNCPSPILSLFTCNHHVVLDFSQIKWDLKQLWFILRLPSKKPLQGRILPIWGTGCFFLTIRIWLPDAVCAPPSIWRIKGVPGFKINISCQKVFLSPNQGTN